MAWIQRGGKEVQAVQFLQGHRKVPTQTQAWDSVGAYYTVKIGEQVVRLTEGCWVLTDDDGVVIDVQTGGKFMANHVNDPSIKTKAELQPPPPSPSIAMTPEEMEAINPDAPIEDLKPRNKGGRPKGSKNKVKPEEAGLDLL